VAFRRADARLCFCAFCQPLHPGTAALMRNDADLPRDRAGVKCPKAIERAHAQASYLLRSSSAPISAA
jgi:hypothetical protein